MTEANKEFSMAPSETKLTRTITDKTDDCKPSILSELLCCPYCGSPGQLRSNKSNKEKPSWNVGCSRVTCIIYRPNFWQHDRQRVIDAWNLRTI